MGTIIGVIAGKVRVWLYGRTLSMLRHRKGKQ